MTRKTSARVVRYGVGDNSVLRLTLHRLWRQKCYWCNTPKDYNDIQIDHIIPQSQTETAHDHLLHACHLPTDFDIHDPRNLAPICSSCNGPNGKGAADLCDTPMLLSKLRRAQVLRPRVIQMASEFGNSHRTAESLVRAIETDLNDPRARRAFEVHAPAIVQKLAMISEAKADYQSVRTIELEMGGGEFLTVELVLNARGRTTLTIIEDLYGCPLVDVLDEGVHALIKNAKDRAQAEFNDDSADGGPMTAGPPTPLFIEVQIDTVDFERQGGMLEVTFAGALSSSLSMSVVKDNADGIGLDELQGDAEVSGRFTLLAMWSELPGNGAPDSTECFDPTWDVEGYLSR